MAPMMAGPASGRRSSLPAAEITHHARVSDESKLPAASRFGRAAMGERLAGFIYGTIVALAVVVAGSRAYPHASGRIAALVAVTSAALWLAHVYAHAVGTAVAEDEHLSLAELRGIARREGSIVEAAVPPVAALLLGAVGIVSTQVAIWLAIALGLVVLAAQGIVFSRVERLGRLATAGVVLANAAFGLVLIALKLLLTH
jgi:hypothetical protein